MRPILLCLAVLGAGCAAPADEQSAFDTSWRRHTVDSSSEGADGVRLADINADGLMDIVTGWEEGGLVRVYVHPGAENVREPWPAVTVGEAPSVEDAVFADLDGDGAYDVISSTEGRSRTIFFHWGPPDRARLLDPQAWKTEALPASLDKQQWMFALPMDIDGKHGIDFFAGSKNEGATVGWFESPANPRELAGWRFHPLYEAGWIMSLIAHDMDGDGDLDLLVTDRKGPRRGALWLENPGPENAHGEWREHRIGAAGQYEAMFAKVADIDGDGLDDVIVATRPRSIFIHRRLSPDGTKWENFEIALPAEAGDAKAVAVGDLDLDGQMDIAFTCEHAGDGKLGAMWLSYETTPFAGGWSFFPIAGPEGVKFDRIELIDIDGDGDLDLLTCEEHDELGVIWYENPAR